MKYDKSAMDFLKRTNPTAYRLLEGYQQFLRAGEASQSVSATPPAQSSPARKSC